MNRKVSCIIPAYNEETRIANVLRAVSEHPLVDEVIVVDDGSVDGTKNVVAAFEDVKLIVQPQNRGKSAAICAGIRAAAGEHVLFLDADLIGINRENVTDLVKPVLDGRADVSISLRGSIPKFWQKVGLDYISGERVLPKQILIDHLDRIAALPGFGLEVFLNRLIIKFRLRVKIVAWMNVASPYKYKKYGWRRGVKSDVKMVSDILKTVSPFELLYQIVMLLSLRVE